MHVGRLRKPSAQTRHTDLSRLSVRMRETRMMASAYKGMVPLMVGQEYALPKAFAHYLIVTGKADHVAGRVGSSARRLKDFRSPKKKQGIPFRKLLSLDD